MAEKRGKTGKLEHWGYEVSNALEVQIPSGRWCRVTERDFRSYNGNRRVSYPDPSQIGEIFEDMITVDYYGPFYYYEENTTYDPEKHKKHSIIYRPGDDRVSIERTSVAGI